MTRSVLNDVQCATVAPFCLGTSFDPGQTGRDPRLFVEAVLWGEGMNATGPKECPNAHRGAVARVARCVWQVELCLQTVPPMRQSGCIL
jgi:hypothetical protein